MSEFKSDIAKESVIKKWIVDKLSKEFHVKLEDRASDYAGIDLILTLNKKEIKVDVKCAENYSAVELSQNSLPTFALEISYLKDKKLKKGWLFDKNKRTEAYLFCWAWIEPEYKVNNKPEHIQVIETILVFRKDIVNYLSRCGFDEERITQWDTEARMLGNEGEFNRNATIQNYFYFYLTIYKEEQPINIIFRKELLTKLSRGRGFLFKNEAVRIEFQKSHPNA